jgi:hypothetical protein
MTPTQEDREAAADYFALLHGETSNQSVNARRGNMDDLPTVQAFMRHRLAAEERGAKMALEAAAKVADQRAITQRALKRPEDWPEGAWNARQVGICNALELTATAIRQTDLAQIVKGQSDAE